MHENNTGWDLYVWRAALWKGTWGSWWITSLYECASAAKKAKGMLNCINKGISSRHKEIIIPVCSELDRPCLKCCVQFWLPLYNKDVDRLERITKVILWPYLYWYIYHKRKVWHNWICSDLRKIKKALGRPYSHVPVFQGWFQRKWTLHFYREGKGREDRGICKIP